MKKLINVLVCLGIAAGASAEVNFDQGVDVKDAIEQAVTLDTKYPGQWAVPFPEQHVRYERDCRTFQFGPGNYAMTSDIALMESVGYIRECHYVPDYNPNGHGSNNPNGHGYHDPHHNPRDHQGYHMECRERPGDSFRRTVQLAMAPRKLLPWESDSFKVCLEGPSMDIQTLDAAYTYNINRTGDYDVRYQLTPLNKIPMSPDENGLSVGDFSYANGKFIFKVNDKWAAEYAGEKVSIKVKLYKDGFLFFNSFKGQKEFTFDAAAGCSGPCCSIYKMTFAENELDTSKAVMTPDDLTRGPAKYFLKWGFKRVGSISTGVFIKKDNTAKIEMK